MLPRMGPSARLRRAPHVIMRPEDDEAFLLVPETGALKLLNPTARAVWELLDGERAVAEVAAAVAASYPEVAAEAITADVARFLGELLEAGLAEVVGGE